MIAYQKRSFKCDLATGSDNKILVHTNMIKYFSKIFLNILEGHICAKITNVAHTVHNNVAN